MKYLSLAAFLLAGCASAPSVPRPVVTHDAPRLTMQFHGDTDFTPQERGVVADAIAALEYQTAGLYRLGVVYDLDFHADITKWKGTPWLVRAESTYPWVELVGMYKDGQILGITLVEPGVAPQVYLVADLLVRPVMLRHVAMHELLHAVGLEDLGPAGSVMSGAACLVSPCEPATCMTPADQAEFCRVARCAVAELNGCAW